MKRTFAIILTFAVVLLISGCSSSNAPDPSKYSEYVCYDYHLACLDAYAQTAYTTVEFDDLKYGIKYRKPVGESDEQFICALVGQKHPLSSPRIIIMQNPNYYIDVFKDWTIKSIELYSKDLRYPKPLWDEDEPARTPSKVLNANTDAVVFDEFINFITGDEYSEKHIRNEDFEREIPNDDYVLYIRVHFNESDNIVWDSTVNSYVSHQTTAREISIDKGRLPEGIASPSSLTVSIKDFPQLFEWISTSIENFN